MKNGGWWWVGLGGGVGGGGGGGFGGGWCGKDNGLFAKHYTHGADFKNIINPWRRGLKAIELGGGGGGCGGGGTVYYISYCYVGVIKEFSALEVCRFFPLVLMVR